MSRGQRVEDGRGLEVESLEWISRHPCLCPGWLEQGSVSIVKLTGWVGAAKPDPVSHEASS